MVQQKTLIQTLLLVSFIACTLSATEKAPQFLRLNNQQSNSQFNVVAFYDGTYDGGHISYVHEALDWFPRAAQQYGFNFQATNNWDDLNADFLSNVQVVMFWDSKPYDWNQQQAFIDFMNRGGGFFGMHVSAFAENSDEWWWYHNDFLGSGAFSSNTWGPTQMTAKVEGWGHPAMQGLPGNFRSSCSEWYSWSNDLRQNPNIEILLSIDPSSFPVGSDPDQSWYDGYYPIVWTNKNYNMIYTNWGHNDVDFAHGNVQKSWTFAVQETVDFTINSLFWLAGQSR